MNTYNLTNVNYVKPFILVSSLGIYFKHVKWNEFIKYEYA